MRAAFTSILNEKIVVFDGAMGTNLQSQELTPDDFGGERFAGCNEHLLVSRPAAVAKVHADFLEAGCDVIETDTFGASPVVLAEYGLAEQAYELNRLAAELARRVAADFETSARPRFVAGSIGPTTKLPSLGHLPFAEMASGFETQARGLLDGGADLLCVETCQDLLQAKAALAGVFRAFAAAKKRIPVIASVTVEAAGTMLLGTEIAAALTALEPFPVDLIGMNCATGPKEMSESIRYLCASSPKPVFVMPNAGIPENVGGHAHYKLSPDEFVYYLSHFVKDLGVQVVGGCCGTTKEHLRRLVDAVGGLAPAMRRWQFTPSVSSLYQSVPLHIDPPPVLVGERTNANGSKLFRELLGREDWEGMVAVGKEQIREGAHILDVCTAYVGRDEVRDMREFIGRLNTQSTAPLMIDSTEAPVIADALERIAGRAIVNSVNLEDGEERLARVLPLCSAHGAAVIALTIDEQGMAKTVDRKVSIARRIHELALRKYGMREEDLIFDTLTFTLGSGDEEFREAGLRTIEAVREIKKAFPRAHTSLGVSNISFGLNPRARHLLNSVFLHYALEYGLDMAIVHASKIMPLYKIPEQEREICRRLIFNERPGGEDPLQQLLALGAKPKPASAAVQGAPVSVEERLKRRIIDGNKAGLQADLDEARQRYAPLEIINTILLAGMKVVGELFGSGQMQLPFVLQSAEAMKAAVGHLEQFMDKAETHSRGTLVLATVKGDVHDIGKNLVDIILTNNGYTVVNLGIQCPLERMLAAFEEHAADAIGMSGLLVKSTLIMKENLEVLNERNLLPPVILGGAALTRRFVEQDLRAVYRGEVHYANDAFDGLRFMEGLAGSAAAPAEQPAAGAAEPAEEGPELSGMEAKIALAPPAATHDRPPASVAPAQIPVPPFYGSMVVENIPLEEVFAFINEVALFRGQWQVRKGKRSAAEYERLVEETIRPEFERLKRRSAEERLLEPKVVYGYFPCQAEGNDLVIYRPRDARELHGRWGEVSPDRLREWVRFTFPRQRADRRRCIADFFAARASGAMDVVAFHVVTMGSRATEVARTLFAADQYKEYLYFHGLGVESAEALAEYWHRRVRRELGIGGRDAAEVRKLFSQQYQGSRYSFGYPACPSLEDQAKLFTILRPERIGVSLTEEFQLVPEQSTSALIVHHPEARYFNVA